MVLSVAKAQHNAEEETETRVMGKVKEMIEREEADKQAAAAAGGSAGGRARVAAASDDLLRARRCSSS